MKKFSEFVEETTTGLVAGVKTGDEPPVKKKKKLLLKRKLNESYQGQINWTEPNSDKEHHEVHYQLAQHKEDPYLPDWAHKRLKQLQNKNEWDKAIVNGKRKVYTRSDVKNTNNTGDEWKEIEKDQKKRRAPTLYGKNKKVERSIILRNPKTGERHLIGGHHRASYVTGIMNRPTEVHEIT